jgi:hypothetical protein
MTEEEEREINKALLTDTELREQYRSLCTLKHELDASQLEPSAQTELNILTYARNALNKVKQ